MTCQTWGADRQKASNGNLEGVMRMDDVKPVGPCCMRILPMPTIDLFMLLANMAPHSSYPLAPTCTYLSCISMQPDHTAITVEWGNDADNSQHSSVLLRTILCSPVHIGHQSLLLDLLRHHVWVSLCSYDKAMRWQQATAG